jgi:hypothetical protein
MTPRAIIRDMPVGLITVFAIKPGSAAVTSDDSVPLSTEMRTS